MALQRLTTAQREAISRDVARLQRLGLRQCFLLLGGLLGGGLVGTTAADEHQNEGNKAHGRDLMNEVRGVD